MKGMVFESILALKTSPFLIWTYLFNLIVNPDNAAFIASNSIFMYYAKIPARVIPYEVVLITLFGVLASYFAALLASKNIMKSSISEVLRDE